MIGCGCPSLRTTCTRTPLAASECTRTLPLYLKKDRAARLLHHPPWPSPAWQRRTRTPSLAAPQSAPPSHATPPSTSPIAEGEACACAWGVLRLHPHQPHSSAGREGMGVCWAVDVPLTSACCKCMFQVF